MNFLLLDPGAWSSLTYLNICGGAQVELVVILRWVFDGVERQKTYTKFCVKSTIDFPRCSGASPEHDICPLPSTSKSVEVNLKICIILHAPVSRTRNMRLTSCRRAIRLIMYSP